MTPSPKDLPRLPAERLHPADDAKARAFPVPPGSEAGRALRRMARSASQLCRSYDLIRDGDRILCAMSGGKDSYAMLDALLRIRARAPIRFEIAALTVHPGFPGFDHETIADFCGDLGVETYVVHAGIWRTLLALEWVDASPCAMCSRLRRGALYRVAGELGFNALALGHHADDTMETALLNMFFAGQLRAMPPLALAEDYGLRVIRPLLHVFEHECQALADLRGYPITATDCTLGEYGGGSQRHVIKRLIADLAKAHPKLRNNLLASLGNVAPEALLDQRLRREGPAREATGLGPGRDGDGAAAGSRKSESEKSGEPPATT